MGDPCHGKSYLLVVHEKGGIKWDSYVLWIWANQPIHLFLVGCLNPFLQGTSEHVVSPPAYVCVCSSDGELIQNECVKGRYTTKVVVVVVVL